MATSANESDKARIWNTNRGSVWATFQKYKPSCCRDGYATLPIVLSIIALFLAAGTIFGVAIRWSQIQQEIADLKGSSKVQTPPPDSFPSIFEKLIKSQSRSYVSYTRWGKKSCPPESELIYSGFGAGASSGSQRLKGGGVNYMCMPSTPEWNKFDLKNDTNAFSWIYAAEYMSYETLGIFPQETHGHNVACCVCLAPRSAKIMIPAMRTCPLHWTKEYEGYLMTSYVTENKMSVECVDQDPDYIGGTQNITGGAQMFFVSAFCPEQFGGIAHCPPYVNARELTCVVCTR